MIVSTDYACDGCSSKFSVEGNESPVVLPFIGASLNLRALMTIIDVQQLEFCSAPCMQRAARAVADGLVSELGGEALALLRSVGLKAQVEADRAAALQLPDPTPVEAPCERVQRSEVLAAQSDPPVRPMGEVRVSTGPAKFSPPDYPIDQTPQRPNQPDPADTEIPF